MMSLTKQPMRVFCSVTNGFLSYLQLQGLLSHAVHAVISSAKCTFRSPSDSADGRPRAACSISSHLIPWSAGSVAQPATPLNQVVTESLAGQ